MNRLLDKTERDLLHEMNASGLRGAALYEQFEGNPHYRDFIKHRGKQTLYAVLGAMRSNHPPKWAMTERAAPVPAKKARRKKPVAAPVPAKKARRKKPVAAPVPAPQNGTPVAHRFRFNNCPHCGCPLHGAQEGLRTEQELRGGQ